jgi:hypothetical protein
MRTRTALLVFVVLGLCVFGRSLLPGRLFVPLHTERLEPWRSELPPERSAELADGEFAAQSDKLISFRADDEITIAALRAGRLPLWNPTNAGGVPHLAQGLYGALYPPHLLFALLGPEHAYGWLAFLHHVLAALFTFLWLRKLGAGDLGALIGGIAFSYSGTLLGRAHYYQYVETLTWLPLGLWCIEHWFDGRRLALCALAPLSGLVLLVAWPQLAAFVLNAWAIVVLVKSLRVDLRVTARHGIGGALLAIALAVATAPLLPDRLIAWALWPHVALTFVVLVGPGRKATLPEGAKPRRAFFRRLGAFGLILGAGAAIAALQYLPAAEWTAYGSRQLSGAPEAQCAAGLRPWYLMAALLPDVFGTPSWSLLDSIYNLPRMFALGTTDEVLRQEQYGNVVENALYGGLLTLVLAILGVLGARGRRGPLVWAALIFLGIAVGARAIVYPAYFALPGLQISPDSRRALVVVALFVAALAAFGVRTIVERPRLTRALAIVLALLGAGALACRWVLDDATLLAPLLSHANALAALFQQAGDVPEHARNEVASLLRRSLERRRHPRRAVRVRTVARDAGDVRDATWPPTGPRARRRSARPCVAADCVTTGGRIPRTPRGDHACARDDRHQWAHRALQSSRATAGPARDRAVAEPRGLLRVARCVVLHRVAAEGLDDAGGRGLRPGDRSRSRARPRCRRANSSRRARSTSSRSARSSASANRRANSRRASCKTAASVRPTCCATSARVPAPRCFPPRAHSTSARTGRRRRGSCSTRRRVRRCDSEFPASRSAPSHSRPIPTVTCPPPRSSTRPSRSASSSASRAEAATAGSCCGIHSPTAGRRPSTANRSTCSPETSPSARCSFRPDRGKSCSNTDLRASHSARRCR